MKLFFLFVIILSNSYVSADILDLQKEGAIKRLQGDQEGVRQVYKQLVAEYPNNPVGYVYFTDSGIYQPIYKSKDISFVTEISGWEVPIVNSFSYSDTDGGGIIQLLLL